MEDVSIAHHNARARWIIAVCVVVCVTAVLVGFPLLLGIVPAGAQMLDSSALRAAALQRTDSLKTVTVPAPSNCNVFIRPDTCAPFQFNPVMGIDRVGLGTPHTPFGNFRDPLTLRSLVCASPPTVTHMSG